MSSKANRNEKANERRALIEQQRKQQKAKERARTLAGSSLVVLVVIGLIAAVYFGTRKSAKEETPGPQTLPAAVSNGSPTTEKAATKVENKTGIDGVVAYDTGDYPDNGGSKDTALSHNHVDGPVVYSVTPPVGGDHNGTWMNAGVYTKAVPTERAVHDMEHGAIWITYRPDLPADQVKQLQDFVGKQSMIDEGSNSNRFMILSPWTDNKLSSPIVFSSWGYQLGVDSPTDARLQKFVDTFRHSKKYTPEYGSAADGVPVSIGGKPALYGSKLANPTG